MLVLSVKGIGQQPYRYECPDFFQLPVNGDKKKMKRVMTMKISNLGLLVLVGIATEYINRKLDF